MTDGAIEIDMKAPCVKPRRTPSERASDALAQLGFEVVTLSDAVRAGAKLSEEQRMSLDGLVRYLARILERAP